MHSKEDEQPSAMPSTTRLMAREGHVQRQAEESWHDAWLRQGLGRLGQVHDACQTELAELPTEL